MPPITTVLDRHPTATSKASYRNPGATTTLSHELLVSDSDGSPESRPQKAGTQMGHTRGVPYFYFNFRGPFM